MRRLFLDDYRNPTECLSYMYKELGPENLIYQDKWEIVRNYPEFVLWVELHGLPDVVSFDHDLADGHYHKSLVNKRVNYSHPDFELDIEKTGYHCAKWLSEYCMDNHLDLPKYIVHSMNPVGKENIESLLNNHRRHN